MDGDAFRWLDDNMVASADAPDEAFDWVYLAHPVDWEMLRAAWSSRPAAWRETLVYLLTDGPVEAGRVLLNWGIEDEDEGVAAQAALALCHQMVEFPETVPIDVRLEPRLREIRRMLGDGDWDELDEVLSRIDATN